MNKLNLLFSVLIYTLVGNYRAIGLYNQTVNKVVLDADIINNNLKNIENIIKRKKNKSKILSLDKNWIEEESGLNEAKKTLALAQQKNNSKRQSINLNSQVLILKEEIEYLNNKVEKLTTRLLDAQRIYKFKKNNKSKVKLLNFFKTSKEIK
ncbi:hypothetical protein [Candidatus Babela massiliensis]|uniref:Uncharacterized protein n=1 Tax=Candidatus Babela massiliensis TaxID=673862 RepID=V6DFI8_9BACT|nr:hypothetical protein [Candidatus Babela massiliensis]CDK30357.1 hypothetical protein BABL1_gene_621 [Candidatus Babela massiliensis]